MATLKRIEIKGFRSIKSVDLELRPLNILIGANGSGKSTLVSFFRMLNWMIAGRLQLFFGTTGRAQSNLHFGPKVTQRIEALLEFVSEEGVNSYSMALRPTADGAFVFDGESLDPVPNAWDFESSSVGGYQESRIAKNALVEDQNWKRVRGFLSQYMGYHFDDTSSAANFRKPGYINDNHSLNHDAGNLAAMLFAYRMTNEVVYRRIVSTIQKIVPEFEDFDLEPDRIDPTTIFLKWRKRGWDYVFGPHQISDGSLRAMALCTLLLQPNADLPPIIVLDEPELGLHPGALEMIAGLFRAASQRSQIVVATQSQVFLDNFEPSEIITVETRMGESVFNRLEANELEDWLEDYSIGELWQRNVLGAGPWS